MMSILGALQCYNGMILISESEIQQQESPVSAPENVLPCKKVLAVTPWKRQRDEILFNFLDLFKRDRPVLIFANSIIEVNLLATFFRSKFPTSSITAIGTIISAPLLKTELSTEYEFLILSAQSALTAFVHGFIRIEQFSVLCFADARGANQNHPFCLIMNYFYTPLRLSDAAGRPRVIGFTGLKTLKEIEQDMFSKRDWMRTLKHYTHTFHCVPMTENDCEVIDNYLESFPDECPLFDPLSIYESTYEVYNNYQAQVHVLYEMEIPEIHEAFEIILFKQNVPLNQIPRLVDFMANLKRRFPQIKKFIHFQKCPKFSAQLSLYAAMRNLKLAAEAPSNQLDPEIANSLVKDAGNLFSQSEHLISMTRDCKRILRNPETGSLLIESTATPILVRACALLSRQFRQSSVNETIRFKTLRVFPVDAEGKRTSTYSSHLTLLRLPPFFYERIKSLISVHPSIKNDRFHLQGPLVNSRHQAQCCAAFEAVRLLFEAGVLDENLLLASEYRKSDLEQEDNFEGGVDTDDVTNECVVDDLEGPEEPDENADSKNVSFNELIPRALLKTPETRSLYIYALEYELKMCPTAEDPLALDPDPVLLTPFSRLLLRSDPTCNFFSVSKSQRTWSILLPSRLPESFVPVEIPIGTDHFLKTELKFIDEMTVDSGEYKKLLQTQQTLFGMFNMKPITVPDLQTLDICDDDTIKVPLDKLPFYLIAPLCLKTTESSSLTEIDEIPQVWELFKSFVEDFRSAPLEGTLLSIETDAKSLCESDGWRIDWNLVERMIEADNFCNLSEYIEALEKYPNEPSVQLEEGGVLIDFKRFALERLAFLTPHTKIFYRMNPRPLPEPVYPSSPFASASYPSVTTHAQYVAARYNLHVVHVDREMLAMKRIENWSDLAVWISDDGASKKRRKKSKTNSSSSTTTKNSTSLITASLIIPELARIFPTSYSLFRVSMILPRVSFEIERQLRIAQFFTDQIPAYLPRPDHLRQIEAMTSSTAALSYSYEQLEVLGDSFLKYYSTLDTLLVGCGWSEGRLSSHRQQILCNANLRRAAEKLQLTLYASFTPFFAKLWCPPAILHEISSTDPLDISVNRTLFDPASRWRCLAAAEGKQVQKQQVYKIDPQGILSIDEAYKTKEQAKNSTDAIYKYGQLIPPKSLADIIEALIGIYYIDCGVGGALKFLLHCGILRPEIMSIRRDLDPMKIVLGGQGSQSDHVDKLKRRKLTPMNSIILESSTVNDSNCVNETTGDVVMSVRQVQSIQVSHGQKVENVLPYAPTFSEFPFPALEQSLRHAFKHRELLFMSCTHSSLDAKLNNERLEWIGDAAIDWIVCRHYWYNYRIIKYNSTSEGESDLCEFTPDGEDTFEHPENVHIPSGHLPLSPESLTNSRQSAINNESFARLVVKYNLHRFLRINSPHLQIEIERFAEEIEKMEHEMKHEKNEKMKLEEEIKEITKISRGTFDLPQSLNQLHTHVSVAAPKVLGDLFEALMGAILLDSNLDIEHFARCFDHFLKEICADPTDLPINAIQETLHLYARLGIPRHQIVFTYREIGGNSDERTLGVICQVWVRERCVAEAEGSNKQVAKKMAMEQALKELKGRKN